MVSADSEGQPTPFQEACQGRLVEVLSQHGQGELTFLRGTGKPPWYFATFSFGGKEHRIEVYPNIVVLHQQDQYFEPYMSAEFKSEPALIEGFAIRLDRYLSGGPWKGPDERGFLATIRYRLKQLFE